MGIGMGKPSLIRIGIRIGIGIGIGQFEWIWNGFPEIRGRKLLIMRFCPNIYLLTLHRKQGDMR